MEAEPLTQNHIEERSAKLRELMMTEKPDIALEYAVDLIRDLIESEQYWRDIAESA